MDEDKKIQSVNQESLQDVSGGNQSYIDKIEQDVQVAIVPEEEKKEINSLLMRYSLLSQSLYGRMVVDAYGGPDWFDENDKLQEELKDIKNKLEAYAKKYPHYPGLK